MKKTRESRGVSADVPEGFGIYIPKALEGAQASSIFPALFFNRISI